MPSPQSSSNTLEENCLNEKDLPYWTAFSYCRSLGSVRMRAILSHFHSMRAAWEAPNSAFSHLHLEESVLQEIEQKKKELHPHKVWESILAEGITAIPFTHERYPALLKEIYDPPALLYVRGNLGDGASAQRVAVVGTRKISSYGERVTALLVRPLAEAGIIIASGLAYGVDAVAHETTLASGGITLAVLGCGIDRATIYPAHHAPLADRIVAQGGALISEHPMGTPPLKHHFLHRNRIIAGLTRATLVTEAPLGSGALATAAYALEYNRDVLAVPGPITADTSRGTNQLIQKGAYAITSAEDLFTALSIEKTAAALDTKRALPNTKEEFQILELLQTDEPIHIDAIALRVSLPPSSTTGTLTLLEMKGLAKNVGGMRYIKL